MSTISDEVREQIELYMSVLITGPLALLGIAANLINFVTFLKQGVKDCVSVCLLALTISDFGSVLNGGSMQIFNIIKHLDIDSIIDPFAFMFIMAYGCILCYDISQGIIAFVTLERCLCVAMPLKFKDLFTFRRSLFVVIFLYAFTIAAYVPHFVTSGLHWRHDPVTNSSRIFVWLSDNRFEIDHYLNTFIHVVMTASYQFVVLISTQVMVIGLKRSSKFRKRKETADKATGNCNTAQVTYKRGDHSMKDHQANSQDIKQIEAHQMTDTQTKDSSLTLQNRRVIKTVSALAVIFLVCNAIRMVVIYTYMSNPELGFFKRYHNEVVVVNLFLFLSQAINSSANTLVYYHFNPSFRNIFRSVFCKCGKNG
ncbi:uncharacterized protein LOC101859267 [Aplysia californica]|uniref:Uncharacterized protein LOC101859267 n=1 Tax=Aplysia californica TaxID=6500 RepID=A0ABM0K3I0_APLCA|nr:uncharacterized protein LOC101859267 [Aplysia californica]